MTDAAIEGPRGLIGYRRDALGYPHIQARDIEDGAFARGWLHAHDRLVQIELNLAVASGRMMELLGDGPVPRAMDLATRIFGFTRDLDDQVKRLSPGARGLLDAYCAGFEAGAKRRGRPLVLRLLGIERAPFTPASILLLYRLVAYFGLTSLALWPEIVMGELVAAGAPAEAFDLLGGAAARDADVSALGALQWPPDIAPLGAAPARGSNAFAVAGRRSASGGALLMTEPHMEVARFPPVTYACHIDYAHGGLYQGVGIPGFAWLSFGRTEHVAWGYTYGHGDAVDVMVERCKSGKHLASGEWRPLRRRAVSAKARGRKAPIEWTLWDTDYGTLVGDAGRDEEIDLPSFRWSGFDAIWSDIDTVYMSLGARTAAELAELHRGYKSISLHAVLADAGGAVAYAQTGQVDVRPAGVSGAMPFAGWGVADRAPAPLDESARPVVVDPPDGCVLSANEARGGPGGERWCSYPEPPYRRERLGELFAGDGKVTVADLVRASYDTVDICARRLLAVWRPHLPVDAEAAALCDWAARQPAKDDAEQLAKMGLFQALHRQSMVALLAGPLGESRATWLVDQALGDVVFGHHVDDVLALVRPERLDAAGLRVLLAQAWPKAKAAVDAGRAPAPVRVPFRNAITQGKIPLLGFDSAPVTFPGGPTTLFQSRIVDVLGLRIVSGPASHYVTDMSDPGGGWYNLPGGASERRFGPGYGRGVVEWRDGRFFPLGKPKGEAPRR
jgi:penicillin amidase